MTNTDILAAFTQALGVVNALAPAIAELMQATHDREGLDDIALSQATLGKIDGIDSEIAEMRARINN